jgi:tetratricopeptide (TPR) repeat protein
MNHFAMKTSVLSILLSGAILAFSPAANAQLMAPNTGNNGNNGNAGPAYLGANAPNDEQSPFTPNSTGVQSAQLTPSLSTPFVLLPTPETTTTPKNAVPIQVSKLLKEKKYKEALVEIDANIKKNPRNVQLNFLRGRTLVSLGQLEQARLEFVSITEKYPELPEPYNNLAVLYASSGKLEAARENLEMALKLAPSDAIAMQNLADVYTRLAAGHYKKAYELNRRLSDAPRKQKLAEAITQEK